MIETDEAQKALKQWLGDPVTDEIVAEVSRNKNIKPADFIKAYAFLSGYASRRETAINDAFYYVKREIVKRQGIELHNHDVELGYSLALDEMARVIENMREVLG